MSGIDRIADIAFAIAVCWILVITICVIVAEPPSIILLGPLLIIEVLLLRITISDLRGGV